MNINGIDKKDNEIISLLLKDARMSYSDIGDRVNLSRTAVKNRIANMESKGIISGYRVMINPQETTAMTTFIVSIETKPECFEEAKRLFASSPETVTLVQTTGKCHMTAFCIAKDVNAMRDFISRVYSDVGGIVSVNARSVIDVIKGNIIS